MLKIPTGRKRLYAVITVFVWLVILVVVWCRREKPLEYEAQSLLQAILAADGSRLMDFSTPEEIQANKLSPEKLHRVFAEVFLPRLNRLKRDGKVVLRNYGDEGDAQFDVITRYGTKLAMVAQVYDVNGEPKAPLLRMVYGAWIMDYFDKHDERFTLISRNRAVLAGLAADSEKLRAIGIVALSDVNITKGDFPMTRLDELGPRYENWIAQLEKEEKARASGVPAGR